MKITNVNLLETFFFARAYKTAKVCFFFHFSQNIQFFSAYREVIDIPLVVGDESQLGLHDVVRLPRLSNHQASMSAICILS